MGRAPCGAEARGMFSSKTLKTIYVRGFHLMSYVREGTALGLVTLMPIIIHYHHKKTMSYCKHEVRTVDSGFRNSEVSANVLFNPNSTGVLCAAPSTFSIITFLVNMLEAKTNPVNLSFDNAETMV